MTEAVESAEGAEYEEPDYTYPLGKTPTPLQKRFADWLMSDAVGYEPATAKTKKEAFEEGVRLAVALRIPYQASDHNREATAAERQEREAIRARKAEEREAQRSAAQAEKEAAAQAAAAAAEAPAPKPAKATKGKAKATPAATPAAAPAANRPAARRAPARRAPATASSAADAPF